MDQDMIEKNAQHFLLTHIYEIEELFIKLERDADICIDRTIDPRKSHITEGTIKDECRVLFDKIEVLRGMGVRYRKYGIISDTFFIKEILEFCDTARNKVDDEGKYALLGVKRSDR